MWVATNRFPLEIPKVARFQVGDELAVLSDDERDTTLGWIYVQQALLAFLAAAATAVVLIQLDESFKALWDDPRAFF